MRSDVLGHAIQIGRFVGSPTILALGVTSTRVALKKFAHYRLWSSVASFFKFGDGTVVAATTDHPLTGGLDALHRTDGTNDNVAGIVSSGTGTLFISEIDAEGL